MWQKLTDCRARRPRQQQRQQLGRVLRQVSRRSMGSRPQPQLETCLSTHASCHTPSRSRFYPELPSTYHQYWQRRWIARPRPRDFCVLRFQGRSSPYEQSIGEPPGQARYHEQHDCLWSFPEQDDEGYTGEIQRCH